MGLKKMAVFGPTYPVYATGRHVYQFLVPGKIDGKGRNKDVRKTLKIMNTLVKQNSGDLRLYIGGEEISNDNQIEREKLVGDIRVEFPIHDGQKYALFVLGVDSPKISDGRTGPFLHYCSFNITSIGPEGDIVNSYKPPLPRRHFQRLVTIVCTQKDFVDIKTYDGLTRNRFAVKSLFRQLNLRPKYAHKTIALPDAKRELP
ncbi:hypothetical protein ACOME3_010447 [Neoechinorhynchus agilis]